ncbi:MAG: DUF721 domain-containing protein [Bacteroidales bacterium]|nr:DUF721 domain-containing protein [Bacteroidales bacterium]
MAGNNEQTLKEALEALVKAYRMEDKLQEIDIQHAWESAMGKLIAKHTKEIRFKNGQLFVVITIPPLKEELLYTREKVIAHLNKELGKDLIRELIIK